MKKRHVFYFSCVLFALLASCSSYVVPSRSVSPANSERRLTVIVYMPADNDLESAALEDLNEMEASCFDAERMSVIALVDRSRSYDTSDGNWCGTRLYEIAHDIRGMNGSLCSDRIACPALGLDIESDCELNMSVPQTLASLLSFAREQYAAEKYALVVWGHGTGWRCASPSAGSSPSAYRAFAFDDESGTYMPLCSLRQAIEEGMQGTKLDLIGFDTCFGAELEVAYELKDCGSWMCGCAGVEPSSGWNYTEWLDAISFAGDGLSLCMPLLSQFEKKSDFSFCCIRLDRVRQLFRAFDRFALSLASAVRADDAVASVRAMLQGADIFLAPGMPSDAYVAAGALAAGSAGMFPAVTEEAGSVLRALSSCTVTSAALPDTKVPLGVYVCDADASGTLQFAPSPAYTRGSLRPDQCAFVLDSAGYVPTSTREGTLLDVLLTEER